MTPPLHNSTLLLTSCIQENCVQSLNYLFINITRLAYEQGHEEIAGGYCELGVDSPHWTQEHLSPNWSRRKGLDVGDGKTSRDDLLLSVQRCNPRWRRVLIFISTAISSRTQRLGGTPAPACPCVPRFYLRNEYKSAVLIFEYIKHGDLKTHIVNTKPSLLERLRLVRFRILTLGRTEALLFSIGL